MLLPFFDKSATWITLINIELDTDIFLSFYKIQVLYLKSTAMKL